MTLPKPLTRLEQKRLLFGLIPHQHRVEIKAEIERLMANEKLNATDAAASFMRNFFTDMPGSETRRAVAQKKFQGRRLTGDVLAGAEKHWASIDEVVRATQFDAENWSRDLAKLQRDENVSSKEFFAHYFKAWPVFVLALKNVKRPAELYA